MFTLFNFYCSIFVHYFFPLSFHCATLLFSPPTEFFFLLTVFFSYKIFIWDLFISSIYLLRFSTLLAEAFCFLFVSGMFIIGCVSIFMMTVLESLSGHSNICVISLLISVDSFLTQFEISLVLYRMSDFQLYPGHLGYKS